MTKEMRELQAKLATAEQGVRMAIGEGRAEDAEKGMDNIRAIRKQIAMLDELEKEERQAANPPAGEAKDHKELEAQYTKTVLKAVRRKPFSADDLDVVSTYRKEILAAVHEGGVATDPDGDASLIVPQDIQTRINTLMRTLNDLSQYVRVETVGTLSGSRVLEADEDMTPLAVVDEYAQIQEMDNPKFTPISYALKKRAGFLPITNELLRDTDQNILAYLTTWIAKKVVVTRNSLITALFGGLTPTTLADLDAVKRLLNVDLEPAISLSAAIITNQDGFHWLDTQKDSQGRYLLTDDITQPGRKLLFGRPVAVVGNRYMPSREDAVASKTWAPLYLGNGQQFSVWFTRGAYELASTREGGEAWRRDTTELRVITRDDLKQWDAAALVKGELDVTVGV